MLSRRTRTDLSQFLQFNCTACGARYFLHKAVATDIDDGLCASCSIEVHWLEQHVAGTYNKEES